MHNVIGNQASSCMENTMLESLKSIVDNIELKEDQNSTNSETLDQKKKERSAYNLKVHTIILPTYLDISYELTDLLR